MDANSWGIVKEVRLSWMTQSTKENRTFPAVSQGVRLMAATQKRLKQHHLFLLQTLARRILRATGVFFFFPSFNVNVAVTITIVRWPRPQCYSELDDKIVYCFFHLTQHTHPLPKPGRYRRMDVGLFGINSVLIMGRWCQQTVGGIQRNCWLL